MIHSLRIIILIISGMQVYAIAEMYVCSENVGWLLNGRGSARVPLIYFLIVIINCHAYKLCV